MRRSGVDKILGHHARRVGHRNTGNTSNNASNTGNNTGNTSSSHAPVQGSTAGVARDAAAESAMVTSLVLAAGVKWLTREAAVMGEGGRMMGVLLSCPCLLGGLLRRRRRLGRWWADRWTRTTRWTAAWLQV